MSGTIMESLFDFFNACPLMSNGRLNIDYLPEDTKEAGVEYSIGITPTDETVTRYRDGGARCRLPFTISSVNDYGADEAQNLLNTDFFDKLAKWMRVQNKSRSYPDLPEGFMPRSIAAIGPGYLYDPDVGAGKYQIQCELEYYRKGD